jgi:hypothetical protein
MRLALGSTAEMLEKRVMIASTATTSDHIRRWFIARTCLTVDMVAAEIRPSFKLS